MSSETLLNQHIARTASAKAAKAAKRQQDAAQNALIRIDGEAVVMAEACKRAGLTSEQVRVRIRKKGATWAALGVV